ncbi:hypothetical protein AB0O01_21040 [Streptomyces sp. NPDC093252]|uniref:zinc finger domain-containing protein n=1 Tax=Streptomyces sp. NPDC093252 TaxID=3154980 RepID=UPI003424E126
MDRRETAAVLAYTGRLDPRAIRTDPAQARDQLAQWHELLHDVPLTTAHGWDIRAAIRAHVLDSPYPILPADIARRWRTHRRERLDRHTDPTPAADPDDPVAWRAELLSKRSAVAAGAVPVSTHREISGGPPRDVEVRLRGIGSCIPPAVRAELARFRPARAAREAAIARGAPDPLGVRCEWCQAAEGEPCRQRRLGPDGAARGNAIRTSPHPSRVDRAAARVDRKPTAA